jgi:3D-(3,5/4)-trihydroxycyclohexane-1,2-dione acylhydrolase (decyclizing)
LRYRDQRTQALTGQYIAVDFKKHAESMGAKAIVASSAQELTHALAAAREADGVSVIVVPVDPDKHMPAMSNWWDVPVAEVSQDESTRRAREAYEKARKRQKTIFA